MKGFSTCVLVKVSIAEQAGEEGFLFVLAYVSLFIIYKGMGTHPEQELKFHQDRNSNRAGFGGGS